MRNALIAVFAVVFFAICGFVIGYHYGHTHTMGKVIVQHDTIVRVDTIREYKPVPVEVRVRDTVLVAVKDTIRRCDTLLMPLPRTEKYYNTPTYSAVVSGFMPSLDYIETYQLTKTITNTIVEPRKKWGFSITGGPAVIYSPFKGFDAGIGIAGGLSYTF